jgi:hypothetical protein
MSIAKRIHVMKQYYYSETAELAKIIDEDMDNNTAVEKLKELHESFTYILIRLNITNDPATAKIVFNAEFPDIDYQRIINTLISPKIYIRNDGHYEIQPYQKSYAIDITPSFLSSYNPDQAKSHTEKEWLILFNLGFIETWRNIIFDLIKRKEYFTPIINESFRARCDFTKLINLEVNKFPIFREFVCNHCECYNKIFFRKSTARILINYWDNPVIWMRCEKKSIVWEFYEKYKPIKLPEINTKLSHIDICLKFSRDPAIYEDVMKTNPILADFVKRNI